MKSYRTIFLKEWQLEQNGQPYNPFTLQPPHDPDDRAKVFTGPENELESISSQLISTPCGILIHGIFGIGKTMFAYEILRRSEGTQTLPIYISYQPQIDFYIFSL